MPSCAFVMIIVTSFSASPPIGCYETSVKCSEAVRETLMMGPKWSRRLSDVQGDPQFRALCIPAR